MGALEPQPQKQMILAIVQLVSGVLTLILGFCVMPTLVGMVGGCVTSPCGVVGLPPIGMCCGCIPYVLVPVALMEIVAGVLGLASPKASGQLAKWVALGECISLLLGGVTTAIAGGVVFFLLQDPEVSKYLELEKA